MQGDSRRANCRQYFLTVKERQVQVCKVFFFSTLGASEQRLVLNRVTTMNTLEGEKRGGRQSASQRERVALVHELMSEQIDRYAKVESHYCREKSTREYFRMYTMFLREWIPRVKPLGFTTYLVLFNGKKNNCPYTGQKKKKNRGPCGLPPR